MSETEAIEVISDFAVRILKFKEDSDVSPQFPGCLHYGFIMPGGFGDADRFYDAMRALRDAREEKK